MEEINQITFNTMHNRISTPADVGKDMYLFLAGVISDARTSGSAHLIDDLYIELTETGDSYAITVYYSHNGRKFPILLSLGTDKAAETNTIWDHAVEFYHSLFPQAQELPRMKVAAPLILDIVLPSPASAEVYDMTADISRCLGWMILSPESIR